MPEANRLEDVFRWIDTHDGDDSVCWHWTGALGGRHKDRGYFSCDGKTHMAHKLVYQLVHGDLEDGEVVRHTCDTPACCNPAHLIKGSRSDNERDKYIRDRAGLPVVVVREIRRMLTATRLSQANIAEYVSTKFNHPVSREAVRNIKLGARRTDGNEQTMEEIVAESTRDEGSEVG